MHGNNRCSEGQCNSSVATSSSHGQSFSHEIPVRGERKENLVLLELVLKRKNSPSGVNFVFSAMDICGYPWHP